MSYKFFGGVVASIPKNLEGAVGFASVKCLKDASAQNRQARKRGGENQKASWEFGHYYYIIYLYLYLYLLVHTCRLLRAVTVSIISACKSLHSIFSCFS